MTAWMNEGMRGACRHSLFPPYCCSASRRSTGGSSMGIAWRAMVPDYSNPTLRLASLKYSALFVFFFQKHLHWLNKYWGGVNWDGSACLLILQAECIQETLDHWVKVALILLYSFIDSFLNWWTYITVTVTWLYIITINVLRPCSYEHDTEELHEYTDRSMITQVRFGERRELNLRSWLAYSAISWDAAARLAQGVLMYNW